MTAQGPWVVVTQKSLDEITGGKLEVISVEGSGGRARLTAAAPELLAACKEAIEWLEDEGVEMDNPDAKRILAAIAKATRRTET